MAQLGARIGFAHAQLLLLRALAAWQSATIESHAADFVEEAWTREDDARQKSVSFVVHIMDSRFKLDAFVAWFQGTVESRLVKLAGNLQFDVETATAWVDDRARHGAVLAAGLRRDLMALRILTSWRLQATRAVTQLTFRNNLVASQVHSVERRGFLAWCTFVHSNETRNGHLQRIGNAFNPGGKASWKTFMDSGVIFASQVILAWRTLTYSVKWRQEKELQKSKLSNTLQCWEWRVGDQSRANSFLAWRLITVSRHQSLHDLRVLLSEWRHQVFISHVQRMNREMKRSLMIQSEELLWNTESLQLLHLLFLDWWAVWIESGMHRRACKVEQLSDLAVVAFLETQFVALLRLCFRTWQQLSVELKKSQVHGEDLRFKIAMNRAIYKIAHQTFQVSVALAMRLWYMISQTSSVRAASVNFTIHRVFAEHRSAMTSMVCAVMVAWREGLQQAKRRNAEAAAVLGLRGLHLQVLCWQTLAAWLKVSGCKKLSSLQETRLEQAKALLHAWTVAQIAFLRWGEVLKRSQRQNAEKAAILGLRGLTLQVVCTRSLLAWHKVAVAERGNLVQAKLEQTQAQRDELACQLVSLSVSTEDVMSVRAALLSWKVSLQKSRQKKAVRHVTKEATRFMDHARQCQSILVAQSTFFAWRATVIAKHQAQHRSPLSKPPLDPIIYVVYAWRNVVVNRKHAAQIEHVQAEVTMWSHSWMKTQEAAHAKSRLARVLAGWLEALAWNAGAHAYGRLQTIFFYHWAKRNCDFTCLGAFLSWKATHAQRTATEKSNSQALCMETCRLRAHQEFMVHWFFTSWRILCIMNWYAKAEVQYQVEAKASVTSQHRYQAQAKLTAFALWSGLLSMKQCREHAQSVYQKQHRALKASEKLSSMALSPSGAPGIMVAWSCYAHKSAATRAIQRKEIRNLSLLAKVAQLQVLMAWNCLSHDSQNVQKIESAACFSIGATRVLAAWRYAVSRSAGTHKTVSLSDGADLAIGILQTSLCFTTWCSMTAVTRNALQHKAVACKLQDHAWHSLSSACDLKVKLFVYRILKTWNDLVQNHTYRDRIRFLLRHAERLESREHHASAMAMASETRLLVSTAFSGWHVQVSQQQILVNHLCIARLAVFLHWRLQAKRQVFQSERQSCQIQMMVKVAGSKRFRKLATQAIVVAWRETLLDLQAARHLRHEALEVRSWAHAALRRLAAGLSLAGHRPMRSLLLLGAFTLWSRCSGPSRHTGASSAGVRGSSVSTHVDATIDLKAPQTMWSSRGLTIVGYALARWKGALMQARMEEAERQAEYQRHQTEQLLGIICLHKAVSHL
eukprot:gnl/MRDRNA2_/MRDRNA2_27933_c0_seq1.p1 gnl/MRDRNA2_/MRDRNA2_27933_c0~~gnl/MRDRNA2_/MRDRNA2_27933_c0_seq1.p1  ORF type:complete len:1429 (+),score=250.76 gnl/MRDRNA2_/MRDRNA2_27933_c0_seq1:371-4288(+)